MRFKFDQIAINSTAKKKPVTEDAAHYIGLEHLIPGTFDIAECGSEVAPVGEKLLMKKGDVLFGRRRAYQRKVGIAPFDGIFSAHGMVLRPRPEAVDEKYFPFFISSDQFMNEAVRISVGSLSPTINWGTLKNCEFDLPPMDEQKKLAELLWAANDLKESYKKAITATDEMLKAKFIAEFGRQNDSRGGTEVRSKWPIVGFEDACEIITDGEHVTPKRVDTSDIFLLSCRNIQDHRLSIDDVDYIDENEYQRISKRIIPQQDDVLISCSGSIGRCCLVPSGIKCQLVRSVALLRFKPQILPAFAEYAICGSDIQSQIAQSATRTSQANLFQGRIKALTIPLPPLSLQREFVAIADKAESAKANLKKSIAAIDQVMKGLING